MDDERRMKIALHRYAAISALVEGEVPRGGQAGLLRELAAEHGHCPDTLWRWARRFRQGGLEALKPPAHRADAGVLKALSPELLAEAVRLREEESRRSTATLVALLERLHPEWQGRIARPTLDRHLRRLGKTRKRLAQPGRVLRRFEKAARNDLWVADFCLPELSFQEGGETHRAILLAIIDHRTRLIVAGGFVPSRQAIYVEEMLKRAILRHGLARALFVDNGAELVGSLVAGGCQHLGIRHLRAHVGEPESRGVVERFFRTFQDSFVPEMAAKAMIPTLAELGRFWEAWLEGFYHARPHAALSAPGHPRSPQQAWDEDRAPLRRVDPVTVDGAFLLREQRRVNKTALVAWDGRSYLCADALVGERVEIRFHPARPESVQIWKDGRFLQVAPRYLPPEDVPWQPKTPPRPTPQESLLDLLDRERRQQLDRSLAGLPTAAAPASGAYFTEAAAAAVLEQALGRNLEGRELQWLAESWRHSGGWQADLTARAVTAYRARYGPGRHLAYYLEFIQTVHLKARRTEGSGDV
jgi:putative transposase